MPQIVTIPISSLGENKTKLKKNSYGLCTVSAFVYYLEDFVPIRKISIIIRTDNYLPPPLCGLKKKKKKKNELPSGIKIRPSPPPILWEHNYIRALNCHV